MNRGSSVAGQNATGQEIRRLTVLYVAVVATTTGAGLVAPLLPVYARDLGAGALEIGLVFATFSLSRTLFVPVFGRLSDTRGRKPFLVLGLLCYFVLALLFILSEDVLTLIALRFGQGLASAMILPVAQAYAGTLIPAQREGRRMGIFNSSMYLGLSLGPVLGGVLKDSAGIAASFLGMAGMTGFAFVLCLLLLPGNEGPGPGRHCPGDTGLVRILCRPRVLSLLVFRTCFTLCVGITWAFLPLVATDRFQASGSAIGILVMVNVLLSGTFQIPMGYLADRLNKDWMVVAGGFLAIPCLLALPLTTSFAGLLLANALFGLAGGVSIPAVMALGVIEGREVQAMGSVMGLLAMAHSAGMLLGPLLGGVIMDCWSFGATLITGALLLAAGTLFFHRMR